MALKWFHGVSKREFITFTLMLLIVIIGVPLCGTIAKNDLKRIGNTFQGLKPASTDGLYVQIELLSVDTQSGVVIIQNNTFFL